MSYLWHTIFVFTVNTILKERGDRVKKTRRITVLPTIDDVYQKDVIVGGIVKRHFDSIVPLLFVSREHLLNFEGITERRSLEIKAINESRGLSQRESSEDPMAYLNEVLGGIDHAPVSALHVRFDYVGEVVLTSYERLDSVSTLARMYPSMTIRDLLNEGPEGVERLYVRQFAFDAETVIGWGDELRTRVASWRLDDGAWCAPALNPS